MWCLHFIFETAKSTTRWVNLCLKLTTSAQMPWIRVSACWLVGCARSISRYIIPFIRFVPHSIRLFVQYTLNSLVVLFVLFYFGLYCYPFLLAFNFVAFFNFHRHVSVVLGFGWYWRRQQQRRQGQQRRRRRSRQNTETPKALWLTRSLILAGLFLTFCACFYRHVARFVRYMVVQMICVKA